MYFKGIVAIYWLFVFDKEDISIIDIIAAKEDSNRTLHELTKQNKMLGKLITLLEKNTSPDEELINDLRKVSEIRGYYAHKFYKENLYKNYLEKTPLVYKKIINNDVSFIYEVHNAVADIAETYRKVAKRAKELGL